MDDALHFINSLTREAPDGRFLLVTPGPHGPAITSRLQNDFPSLHPILLETGTRPPSGDVDGNNRLPCVRAVPLRLPFLRDTFDGVLSFETLHSIRPHWTVMAEYHRILKPDGRLFLLEPAPRGAWAALLRTMLGPCNPALVPTKIRQRLRRAGFAVETMVISEPGQTYPLRSCSVWAGKISYSAGPIPNARSANQKRAERSRNTASKE